MFVVKSKHLQVEFHEEEQAIQLYSAFIELMTFARSILISEYGYLSMSIPAFQMVALKVLLCMVLMSAVLVQQGNAGWFRIRIRWRKVATVVSNLVKSTFL